MLLKAFIDDSKALKTLKLSDWIFLSTQLHEEMHWCFPIAGNGAFRALIFDFISVDETVSIDLSLCSVLNGVWV